MENYWTVKAAAHNSKLKRATGEISTEFNEFQVGDIELLPSCPNYTQ